MPAKNFPANWKENAIALYIDNVAPSAISNRLKVPYSQVLTLIKKHEIDKRAIARDIDKEMSALLEVSKEKILSNLAAERDYNAEKLSDVAATLSTLSKMEAASKFTETVGNFWDMLQDFAGNERIDPASIIDVEVSTKSNSNGKQSALAVESDLQAPVEFEKDESKRMKTIKQRKRELENSRNCEEK